MKINFKNKVGKSIMEITSEGVNLKGDKIIVNDKSLKELAELEGVEDNTEEEKKDDNDGEKD